MQSDTIMSGIIFDSFWFPYDLYTQSYVMFCVHLGILISSIVGMIRLDGFFGLIKHKKKEDVNESWVIIIVLFLRELK